jgi:hypothetical protein
MGGRPLVIDPGTPVHDPVLAGAFYLQKSLIGLMDQLIEILFHIIPQNGVSRSDADRGVDFPDRIGLHRPAQVLGNLRQVLKLPDLLPWAIQWAAPGDGQRFRQGGTSSTMNRKTIP